MPARYRPRLLQLQLLISFYSWSYGSSHCYVLPEDVVLVLSGQSAVRDFDITGLADYYLIKIMRICYALFILCR